MFKGPLKSSHDVSMSKIDDTSAEKAQPIRKETTVRCLENQFTDHTPDEKNPLKDFMKAKFATKAHGLINSYSANTHQGISRNYNEDRVSIIMNIVKPKSKPESLAWPTCSFFAIYDGHGGNACADYLKDCLHKILVN